MKKIILLTLILFSSICGFAQRYEGLATNISCRVNTVRGWTNWTAPQKCRVRIAVDITNDRVIVYTDKTQIYNIISADKHYYYKKSECWDYTTIDQDGDVGKLTIKVNGKYMRIFIKFADLEWVYYIYQYV